MKVAVLLTCHNRRALTIACLRSLTRCLPDADVFLTDDGSVDGTAEAVKAEFPLATIVRGDGSLYWCRGMRLAWQQALNGRYDHYLWLNDDTVLYDGFFDELSGCASLCGGECIVCGLVEDQGRTSTIYGGYDARNRKIQADGTMQDVVRMNGNLVLVPRVVVERIGILDSYFIHDLGDVDYGLTARRNGIRVVSTRKNIAQGVTNAQCRVRQWGVDVVKRFQRLNSPLGSPLSQNFYFRRKHYGWLHACAFILRLVFINVIPDGMVALLWGDKYRPAGNPS